MSNSKLNLLTAGKYSDFKKEEYSIMMTRIDSINNVMTEKCKSLSLKPLEKNFSFDFVFRGMSDYLKKIDEYDKKPRKDDLKKWWMNQKASEMAKDCLPSILDRMDQIAETIAKQERSELSRNKFEQYIKFELLECALKSSFRRPRASSANVFPNTSFQYARSRLRKKLENVYFTETELVNMPPNDKKKKEEWIKLIEVKKNKLREEYQKEKTKKQKLKKKHKRMKQKLIMGNIANHNHNHKITMSVSSSSVSGHRSSMAESVCSSTGESSDLPIIDTIIPPPPPLNDGAAASVHTDNNTHNTLSALPPALDMNMPLVNTKKPHGYCSQCTTYAIQLSKLTKELHSFKISLGETQMQLNNTTQEINRWKQKYKEKCNQLKEYQNLDSTMDWKQKYEKKSQELRALQSQIGLLIQNTQIATTTTSSNANMTNSGNSVAPTLLGICGINNNIGNINNVQIPPPLQQQQPSQLPPQQQQVAASVNIASITNIANRNRNDSAVSSSISRSRQRHNSQEMSFQSSEFSVNAISDKMSISGNSSLNRYNFMTADSVITGFPAIAPMSSVSINGDNMSQIVAGHLKHNSNSTEKMIERLQAEVNQNNNHHDNNHNNHNRQNSNSGSFLDEETENLLFPITSNNANHHMNHGNMNNGNNHNNHNNNLLNVPSSSSPANNSKDNSNDSHSQATTHSTFSMNQNGSSPDNNNMNHNNNHLKTNSNGHRRNNQHLSNNLSLDAIGVVNNGNNNNTNQQLNVFNNTNNNNNMNGNLMNISQQKQPNAMQQAQPPPIFASNGNMQIVNGYQWNNAPKANNSPFAVPRDRNMSLSSNGNAMISMNQNHQYPNNNTPQFIYNGNQQLNM